MRKKAAFTLLEIMIEVSIIALLAVMAIPIHARTAGVAKREVH